MSPGPSRRELLRLAVLAGGGALVTGCRRGLVLPDERALATAALTDGRAGTEWARRATATPGPRPASTAPAPDPAALGVPSTLALTPNEAFYTMKFNPEAPPVVDPAAFRLEVGGLVASPLSLSLAELEAAQGPPFMRSLECISNPAGGGLIGNAVWRGLPLAALLARAGPLPAARFLRLESLDGYHTGIDLALATDPRSMLVLEMNGEPLPPDHGAPLRCLFPGRYGQKQPKWLHRVTLQAEPHRGHWERQGWSDTAVIQVNSRIDAATRPDRPGEPLVVHGIAFSDDSGVATVELLVDRRDRYPASRLHRAPEPFTPLVWTEWEWTWPDPPPGSHVIQARARDGKGLAQRHPRRNLLSGTFPDGTSDMHQVTVQVPG